MLLSVTQGLKFSETEEDTYLVYCGENKDIESVVIPSKYRGKPVSGIRGFSNCVSLKSVTIPDSVTSIGSGAFSGCISLTSIVIPNSVQCISSDMFEGCTSLTNVTLPETLISIEYQAFKECVSLVSINIPKSVKHIDSSAFEDCYSLRMIKYDGTKSDWYTIVGSTFEYYIDYNLVVVCSNGKIEYD